MTKWRPVLYASAIVLLGMLYVRACWEPSIRADERRRAEDRGTDSIFRKLEQEAAESLKAFTRERDSTGRVIRALRARTAPQKPADNILAQLVEQIAVRDSLILAHEAGRQQDSLQLLFWRSAVAQRDSIIPRLQQARDSWRREASKPRHTVTDIAGGVLLGFGAARESEVLAATGGALILVPRVVDAIGRLF